VEILRSNLRTLPQHFGSVSAVGAAGERDEEERNAHEDGDRVHRDLASLPALNGHSLRTTSTFGAYDIEMDVEKPAGAEDRELLVQQGEVATSPPYPAPVKRKSEGPAFAESLPKRVDKGKAKALSPPSPAPIAAAAPALKSTAGSGSKPGDSDEDSDSDGSIHLDMKLEDLDESDESDEEE